VTVLTDKTWSELGPPKKNEQGQQVPWAVHFYAADCRKCGTFAKHWEKVAKALAPDGVKVGAVNCASSPTICRRVQVALPSSFVVFPASGAPEPVQLQDNAAKAMLVGVLRGLSSSVQRMNAERLNRLTALKCDEPEAGGTTRDGRKRQSMRTKKDEKTKTIQKPEVLLMNSRKDSPPFIRLALRRKDISFSQGSLSDAKLVKALLTATKQKGPLSSSTLFVIHPPKSLKNPKAETVVQFVQGTPTKELLDALLLTFEQSARKSAGKESKTEAC